MTIKLGECEQGIIYTVSKINGSRDTIQYLSNIGLSIGDSITIISKIASIFIINIKDGRFGIDKGIATLIEVEKWGK
jgi:ferrous iron transport protein A